MNPSDRARLFEDFTDTVFRLETLQTYVAAQEAEYLNAFHEGRPMPELSVLTSPWLRSVALSSIQGRRWSRVRIVEYPLTEYTRFALANYARTAVVGEAIHIAERGTSPDLASLTEDFWLFDADTDHPVAMFMRYHSDGRFRTAEIATDPATVNRCRQQRDLALAHSVPLNQFLAEKEALIHT